MTERRAWLAQSISDLDMIARTLDPLDASTYCHAIAKCQQAVEKAVKALVAGLRDARIVAIEIGYRHDVARFLPILVRMPHATEHGPLQRLIHRFLDPNTRRDIAALDRLAPRRPPPFALHARNSEYPYQEAIGPAWKSPSSPDAFTIAEVTRYRALAHRLVVECQKLVFFIEHGFL